MILFLLLSAAGAPAQGMLTNSTSPPVVVAPATPPPELLADLRRAIHPPRERQPFQSLFSPDDYPAAGNGRRGVVAVKLIIDPQGRVMSCWIKRSSGQSVLDMTTCNVLRRRARFTPASDAGGNPVIGQIPVQVDWDEVFRRFQ